MDKSEKTIVLVLVLLLLGACCLLVLCGGVFYLVTGASGLFSTSVTTSEPVVIPTQTAIPEIFELPTPNVAQPGEGSQAGVKVDETLAILQNAVIPSADLIYLAERYEGKTGIPLQSTIAPVAYSIGDTLDFYKLNVDTNNTSRITAVLRYASEHVYFWVEQGVDLDAGELNTVMRTFEDQIYPTNQEFFGKEWIPGVDNDPHLYLLYASGLGSNLAGYTASSDGVVKQAHEYSNVHEMFYINSDVQTLSDPYTLSVMAHEFQHLIHGYHDPNEELWMNEGFSELATLLNGYDAGGFDYLFAFNTDVQLNDWSIDANENDVHYGASFLFVTYLLERFGEDFTKALVADQMAGFSSIDNVLSAYSHVDPETGRQITANDLFTDWSITNYINDPGFADGRYAYKIYDSAPTASSTETITDCDNVQLDRSVHQYGTDYIRLTCTREDFQLRFTGSPTVKVLPVSSNGDYFMWSNRADASATKLTREFDFTNVAGPISFTYSTWYEIEEDYDFLYLLASTDDGHGRIINTPSCSFSDITGNSYGCGYNGVSNGWITETVDLSQYAGKVVTLSFEYITDEAVTGEGFILDDIRIPEIDYLADFEKDDGGWTTEGFVRIDNILPQTFLVSVIDTYSETPIQKFTVSSGEDLNISLNALPDGYDYVLVVSGTSRFTRQKADYQISLRK